MERCSSRCNRGGCRYWGSIVEHAITNGTTTPVNGDDVVYGAIEGAVMSSVGSVVRIGGWIANIIK